jgi:hypothetical protein
VLPHTPKNQKTQVSLADTLARRDRRNWFRSKQGIGLSPQFSITTSALPLLPFLTGFYIRARRVSHAFLKSAWLEILMFYNSQSTLPSEGEGSQCRKQMTGPCVFFGYENGGDRLAECLYPLAGIHVPHRLERPEPTTHSETGDTAMVSLPRHRKTA